MDKKTKNMWYFAFFIQKRNVSSDFFCFFAIRNLQTLNLYEKYTCYRLYRADWL